MATEEPPFYATSPLDKPLHQLTEDDISQITREQCRHYLKQKGMRRPSWNKSQAIQQVIMLKALIEPSTESETCVKKFYITHRQHETLTTRVQNGTIASELVPGQQNNLV
ncbi:protein TIFY 4B-like [Rutidosis leptorrhynchoides]|uniref:protein TIFY 4B-like n=1 Tax=Rutidosis leptorrhynchoides TaxID=125765 RepID=UPI003A9991CC